MPVDVRHPSEFFVKKGQRMVEKPGVESSVCRISQLTKGMEGLEWQPIVKTLVLIRVERFTFTEDGPNIKVTWALRSRVDNLLLWSPKYCNTCKNVSCYKRRQNLRRRRT
ncbi:uncharacterized protein LOC122507589 [Leptopilina heterotoma]|uniref:uncharacterized protein LOC122507589 n=1 Tax=Leptopilina heterotoma TaxID=63436 RepID=UPI001CA93A1B|nr:uncharacterized protein LOC122507589 [Leptopilina heterotoma]